MSATVQVRGLTKR